MNENWYLVERSFGCPYQGKPFRMPTVVNSSLTYEILMYLNSFYFGMFAVCELGMGLFKAANLPSPGTSTTLTEFALLFFLIATEGARIYLGRKGNLTERGLPILIGIFLTFPSSLATLYFLFWQNYVLKLEVILCSIQLVILALELIISIMYLIAIYRPPSPKEWSMYIGFETLACCTSKELHHILHLLPYYMFLNTQF